MKRLKNKTSGILNFIDYKKPGYRLVYYIILFVLIIAVLTALLPPMWLFISSFKDASEIAKVPYSFWPESFNLSKLIEVWNMLDFGKYFINTLIVVLGAVTCSIVFNGLVAYTVAIVKPKGHKLIFALVLAGYMIPAMTSIVPLYSAIVKMNWINSFMPLSLIFGANAFLFNNV